MTLIRSVSGIRGIAGDDIHPQLIAQFAGMFASFIKTGTVITGRDTRKSGKIFDSIFSSVLNYAGIDTIRLGIVPTPTVLYLVSKHNSAGGYIITASHNPPEYNGLKFVSHSGKFLNKDDYSIFSSFEGTLPLMAQMPGHFSNEEHMFREHISGVIEHPFIDRHIISRQKPRVVFDGANGGGSIVIAEMIEQLGAELITINTNTDGTFTRALEPIPANLSQLENAVREKNADIGLATDGDGDRIAVVTPVRGSISEEYTIALCADYIASKYNGNTVVINQSTSSILELLGEKNNYSVVRTPVGEANVVDGIISHKAIIGGEGNGGVILPEINKTRDALVASALLLMLIAENNNNIDALIDSMPVMHMKKEKFSIMDDKVLTDIARLYRGFPFTDNDGLRFQLDNGFMHIRKSGTEPIIRVIGEFDSEEKCEEEFNKVRGVIQCVE